MCTAFSYCRVGVQRLLEVIYAIIATGGFLAGPRTLRPERLQWLTTSAANRQAFMRTNLWSRIAASIAHGASGRSTHRVDTVRSGALEELPLSRKDAASLTQVWVHFFSQNSASGPSLDGAFPPAFAKPESGVRLS